MNIYTDTYKEEYNERSHCVTILQSDERRLFPQRKLEKPFTMVISSHFATGMSLVTHFTFVQYTQLEHLEHFPAVTLTYLRRNYMSRKHKGALQLPTSSAEAKARSPRGFAKPDIHRRRLLFPLRAASSSRLGSITRAGRPQETWKR